ncbi:MAG: methylated-DNA--[protein]-cysteine S-methyltransferase [Bryobacteraceae bacterium]
MPSEGNARYACCAEAEFAGIPLHVVASGTGIRRIEFGRHQGSCIPDAANPVVAAALEQLAEYFSGARTRFELQLEPEGTEFQKRVWKALERIPYGETRSYAEIAREAGSPKGFRAAGAANGQNPIAVVVPCHRVIGSNGSLTGFGGGLRVKKILLELEASVHAQRGRAATTR